MEHEHEPHLEPDLQDPAPPAPHRPRWRPESADDARYAHLGYSDVDSARYDAAHRSSHPRE